MVVVPLPLLLHLGHPGACIQCHDHSAYDLRVCHLWLCGRFLRHSIDVGDLVCVSTPHRAEAQQTKGPVGWIYRIATLGSYDLSDKAMNYDRKWLFALAIIGIPGAHGLHGYVGFVFGSLKSREWWSSDLMPAIFLFSAIISGTALVIVLYVVSCKLRKVPVDLPCLKVMAYSLWGFMMFTLLLEGLEFASYGLPRPGRHRGDHGLRQRPTPCSLLHPAIRHWVLAAARS